jgi:glyoxylase-like metal-dependent hydrolase (beta-lactamase superfamily II)
MADLHSTLVKFDIVVGEPVTLTPLVRRITAPNPSPFTGPGTNTYLVGHGDEVAVIDPGPDDPAHIAAILRATGGKIRWVIATHTHADHSPAGKPLADATGAELIGMPYVGTVDRLDETFVPKRPVQDGERIEAGSYTLRAVFTPGHVSNHMSFLLEEERLLFAGDHIMQGATVVIVSSHGGTMWDYLDSLQKLKGMGIEYLAPAHGHLLSHAEQVVTELHAHRLSRERKAIAALQQVQQATLSELIPLVYPEVGSELTEAAKIALRAHLRKLEHDGIARTHQDQHWLTHEETWIYCGAAPA